MGHYRDAHIQAWGENRAVYTRLLHHTPHDDISSYSDGSNWAEAYYTPAHMKCPGGGMGCCFFAHGCPCTTSW